jgi:23S rRNA-intervening sequence protein
MPRPAARTFQDLLVWRQAHAFVLAVYQFTAAFPKQETYGLALQMRRAAVSIPANIAEGFRKRSKPDKARYLNMAEGFGGGESILSDPGARSGLWANGSTHGITRRSQPSAPRLRSGHSDF